MSEQTFIVEVEGYEPLMTVSQHRRIVAALSNRARVPSLNKTREEWRKVDAKFSALHNSTTANFYLISDAKQDIEKLHAVIAQWGDDA